MATITTVAVQAPTLGTGLAGAMYDCQYLMSKCESIVWHSLGKAFTDYGGADKEPEIKRLDYYDASIEFWAELGAELSEDDQEALRVLGFSRCWVCYRGRPESEEKYYEFRGWGE